jgi:hypothetical protein
MRRKFAIAAASALAAAGLATAVAPAASAASNPYDAQDVCGQSFKTIDSEPITGATIYLTYNGSSNCVATIKTSNVGSPSYTGAYLAVQGGGSAFDDGDYSYYAGPVKLAAAGKCVMWGGDTQSDTYTSPWEHCG